MRTNEGAFTMMKVDTLASLSGAGKNIIQIEVIDDTVYIWLSNWKVFPCLYDRFLDGKIACTDKKTLDMEGKGEVLMKLIKDGKSKEKDFFDFCSCVIKEWGGKPGNRVWGKFEKNNRKEYIAECIRKSAKCLENKNIKDAIKEITELKWLGVSYGSKILRMLSPEQTGVYDSVLAKYLPYDKDVENKDKRAENYAKFCADCKEIIADLNKHAKKNDWVKKKNGREWRVADVEAVLFFACYKKQKIDVTYEL